MAQLPIDEALNRFKDNEDRLDKFVNDETGYTSSAGENVESIPAFLGRIEDEIEATTGTVSENLTASEAARVGAEAARDAAFVNADVYPDVATGLASVANDVQFQVVEGGEIIRYRRDSATTYTPMARYPTARTVGTVVKSRFPFSFSDSDDAGPKASLIIDSSGKWQSRAASIKTLNGRNSDTLMRDTRRNIVMPWDVGHVGIDGQSLAGPGTGGSPFNLIAKGDSWAWPYKIDSPAQGTEVPFTDDNHLVTGIAAGSTSTPLGADPSFGFVAMLRQLLLEEEGVELEDQPRLYVGNQAVGSTAISAHVKNTTPYNRTQQQAAATRTYARNNGLRGRYINQMWVQGEADVGNTASYYYSMLLLLAQNHAADYRAAAPEQNFHPLLTTYQMTSSRGVDRWGPGRAQHKLAIDYPDLIGFGSPIYHMPFSYDYGGYPAYNTGGLHVTKLGAYWLGAHHALAYKRKRLDGLPWLPIRCISRVDDGDTVFLTFALRGGKRLVIDTNFIPAQTNFGIGGVNENDASPIVLANPPKLCKDFATISLTRSAGIINGLRFDFGQPAFGMYPYSPGSYGGTYTGAALNFRDDYSLRLRDETNGIDLPMYDVFPVHSIRLTASGPGFEIVL